MTLRLAAGAVATLVLALAGWWLFGGFAPDDGRIAANGGREDAPVPITPRGPGPAGWSIEPAQTVAIDGDELPTAGKVAIDLVLDVPSADARPLAGRILSMDEGRDDRLRELAARVVGDDRVAARIEVPVEFLTDDAYLIELTTTERSHFPLRRYRLDVR